MKTKFIEKFKQKYGPWAVVTGASSGIGTEFAKQLAAMGLNLVLVARRKDRLENLKQNLEQTYNIKVRIASVDLTHPEFLSTIRNLTEDIAVGLLVSNAGMMYIGHYLENNLESEMKMIDLNIKAPSILTHYFGKKMIERGKGGIIYTASMLGFMGTPYATAYAATKAYEVAKAEGLAYELKSKGVDVLALNPGLTETEMTADYDFSAMPMKLMKPEKVARTALHCLGRRTLATPGKMNNMMNFFAKHLMSRQMNTKMFGGFMRKTF